MVCDSSLTKPLSDHVRSPCHEVDRYPELDRKVLVTRRIAARSPPTSKFDGELRILCMELMGSRRDHRFRLLASAHQERSAQDMPRLRHAAGHLTCSARWHRRLLVRRKELEMVRRRSGLRVAAWIVIVIVWLRSGSTRRGRAGRRRAHLHER